MRRRWFSGVDNFWGFIIELLFPAENVEKEQ
jgi:hypothetical protein